MKLIPIYTCDIARSAAYMHDTEGRMDLLGQILFTGFNIPVPMKTRSPSELDHTVHPFTTVIRTYVRCNTSLTMQMLANIGLSPKQQIDEANKLLAPYNIQLQAI